jgi:hypothetical protein
MAEVRRRSDVVASGTFDVSPVQPVSADEPRAGQEFTATVTPIAYTVTVASRACSANCEARLGPPVAECSMELDVKRNDHVRLGYVRTADGCTLNAEPAS